MIITKLNLMDVMLHFENLGIKDIEKSDLLEKLLQAQESENVGYVTELRGWTISSAADELDPNLTTFTIGW